LAGKKITRASALAKATADKEHATQLGHREDRGARQTDTR
jgi:hypothetical protein